MAARARAATSACARFVGFDGTLTNRQRLRQPEHVARRQRARHQPPAPRLIERLLERGAERVVELDVDARRLAQLQRQAELDAPARHDLRDQRAHVAFDRGERLRNPQLQIEMAMVDRANRDADRGAIVVAVDGRKALSSIGS